MGRSRYLRKTVVIRCAICIFVLYLFAIAYSLLGLKKTAYAQEADFFPKAGPQHLVENGVDLFKQGNLSDARKELEKAETQLSENYAVPYYLGLIYLKQDRRAAAISQWQRYVALDPESDNSKKIRKYLTLLLRQEAEDQARKRVADEAALQNVLVEDNTIAVAPFQNLGSKNLGPLGKGMAAMLISDLSQVPDLQVVDRIMLDALLREMKLSASAMVDAGTAPHVGRMLKASHMASGSLADLEKDYLHIASAVFDTKNNSGIGTQEVQGRMTHFYDLEKKIACDLIEDLGKRCDKMPSGFHKVHTKHLPALVAYSQGLAYFDEENYDGARKMFQKALDEDSDFDLAREALWATPVSALLVVGSAKIFSDISSSGISSSAAGSATAGGGSAGAGGSTMAAGTSAAGTGTGSTVAAGSSAVGGAGISTTTLVAAGAAVTAGTLAITNNIFRKSPKGGNVPFVQGTWRGRWTDTQGGVSQVVFHLDQHENSLSGSMSAPDNACMPEGNVSGRLDENNLQLTVQSGRETITIEAFYNQLTKTINGQWRYSSGFDECMETLGQFQTTLTGNAVVSW